ncbi:MAG TPA: glycosyltransferase, partial [Coriobacteriia bacterium]|nr:glycosyltransferase [Coriobacteriia bacterium]
MVRAGETREDPGPLVSVVMVTLNARPFVAEALESLARQTARSFELFVVDGGSTDGTIDDVRAYEARLEGRMRWISEPDGGLYDAMNKGLAAAEGRYVAYLGADDRLVPGALAAVERAVRAGGEPAIVAGAVRVIGGAREWVERPRSYAKTS